MVFWCRTGGRRGTNIWEVHSNGATQSQILVLGCKLCLMGSSDSTPLVRPFVFICPKQLHINHVCGNVFVCMCTFCELYWTIITYDYKALIRTGKWSTHCIVNSPPADSATWPDKVFRCKHQIKHWGKGEGDKHQLQSQPHRQDHLSIHLNIRGNTEVKVERLNAGCDPGHMDLLWQASC